jgi:hypothetical protein
MRLFILFLLCSVFIVFLYTYEKEGFILYNTPIRIDENGPIFKKMVNRGVNSENVTKDLKYFNNASHIQYGLERIPV